MKKEDFKTLGGIALIANLTLALWVGMLVTLGIWLFWKSNEMTFILFIGFFAFSLIGGALNVWAGGKLKSLKLKGTSKLLVDEAIKFSYWFFFPVIFSLMINRIRSAMWEWVITARTSHIDNPIKKIEEEYKILEELKEDGFVSQRQYQDSIERKPDKIANAKKILEEQKKNNPHTKNKDDEEEDEWIY